MVNLKNKNSIQEIKKFQKKLAIFLVFSLIINILVLFFFLSGFSLNNFANAISNNYGKVDGSQLTKDDWNNLPNDFVDQSGDSMSGALTIDGSDNSGLRLKSVNADPNYWSIYSHKDYGDLNFWYGNDKLTIKKDTGNVGIGTASPIAKLDINGNANIGSRLTTNGLQITGGNPGAGKVLTSDANGVTSWGNFKVASGQNVRGGISWAGATEIDLANYGFNPNGPDPHIIVSEDDYNDQGVDGNSMDASQCGFQKDGKLKFKVFCAASTISGNGYVTSSFDWLAIQLP